MDNLTRNRVLNYIISYKRSHDGNSPDYREIGKACYIASTSTVKYHLRLLEELGKVKLRDKTPRSIQVIGGKWIFNG